MNKTYRSAGEAYPCPIRTAPWVIPAVRKESFRDGFLVGLKWGAFLMLLAEIAWVILASHVYHKVVGG